MPPTMDPWRDVPVFGVRRAATQPTPRPSAYALIADGSGRIAAVRTGAGVFLPGGGIEPGETPEVAAARETLEECGLVVRWGSWSARAVQFVDSKEERTYFEKLCTFVDVVIVSGNGAGGATDHELLWLPPETASEMMSHESHAWAIALWSRQ